jgi:prepilin-type N-terminal cleavage/methylation domain-containing protein
MEALDEREDNGSKKGMIFGFTLIEMLVVMAILSLIASFVSSRVWDAQKDARDAQRKQDLSVLRSAVSIFRDQKDRWPSSLSELKTSGTMTILPVDPSEGDTYGYATSSSNYDVCLVACMEEAENADSSSVCSSTTFNDPAYIKNCPPDEKHYLTL